MKKPSVIFMGSKPASIIALSLLIHDGWNILFVIPSKDFHRPWIGGPLLEEYARKKHIPITTQDTIPRTVQADFVISYMFRDLVKPHVLNLAKRAAVNFHPAPLPEFGGWAFYNVAILEDSKTYGCTCHYMDNHFDTGPILKVRTFPIDPAQETALSLERKTQSEMLYLFKDFCVLATKHKQLPKVAQNKKKMRYLTREQFYKLKKIPNSLSEYDIQKYARAFWYPPFECGYRLNHHKIEIIPEIAKNEIGSLLHANDFEDLKTIGKKIEPHIHI